MWYKNVAGRFFGLVTKHACDGRTDGQNYDSQDRASIAREVKTESEAREATVTGNDECTFTDDRIKSPYFTMGRHFLPLNTAPTYGDLNRHVIHSSRGL